MIKIKNIWERKTNIKTSHNSQKAQFFFQLCPQNIQHPKHDAQKTDWQEGEKALHRLCMKTYDKMAQAVDYLVANHSAALSLQKLADIFDEEPTAFQKKFQCYVGVTPKQLQKYMSMHHARELLLRGDPTLEAAYEAGLSGNGRLHDLCVSVEAATPGAIKSKGQGVRIIYGWHQTPFGDVLIAQTEKGICWLSFELEGEKGKSFERLRARFSNADFTESRVMTEENAGRICALWKGETSGKIRLNLFGANFQIQVWQALLKIPQGGTVSYGTIANALSKPSASRAVGAAVGANPVSYIIPCHRVIQKSGLIENYAWGSARKKVLLGLETSP